MTVIPGPDRKEFTRSVIRMYLTLPETPERAGRTDWVMANNLFDRKIARVTVKQALLLASVRRLGRPPDMPRLAPIRSLHYFVPVIEELLEQPLPDGYPEYLQRKIIPLTKLGLGGKISGPALDQISTIFSDR